MDQEGRGVDGRARPILGVESGNRLGIRLGIRLGLRRGIGGIGLFWGIGAGDSGAVRSGVVRRAVTVIGVDRFGGRCRGRCFGGGVRRMIMARVRETGARVSADPSGPSSLCIRKRK